MRQHLNILTVPFTPHKRWRHLDCQVLKVRNTVYEMREIRLMSVLGRWVVPLVGQRQPRLLPLSKVHDDDTEQHKVQEKPRAQRLTRSKFLQPIMTRSKLWADKSTRFCSFIWMKVDRAEVKVRGGVGATNRAWGLSPTGSSISSHRNTIDKVREIQLIQWEKYNW